LRIRAAVVERKSGPFVFRELDLDEPRVDEVLVRIVATGICQTDIHVRNEEYPVPLPLVLGHEGAGVVEPVGAGVGGLKAGDHVVMSYPSCGHCRFCHGGHNAYCEHTFEMCFGGSRLDGSNALHWPHDDPSAEVIHGAFFGQSSFATYAVASASSVVKVPGDLLLELLAPLGCGFQTGAGAVLNSLQVRAGSSLAVFGAAAVGLAAIMAAKIAGAAPIIEAPDQILEYDFNAIVAGHVNRWGTREDAIASREYIHDSVAFAQEPLEQAAYRELIERIGYSNVWVLWENYLNDLTNYVTKKTLEKKSSNGQTSARWRRRHDQVSFVQHRRGDAVGVGRHRKDGIRIVHPQGTAERRMITAIIGLGRIGSLLFLRPVGNRTSGFAKLLSRPAEDLTAGRKSNARERRINPSIGNPFSTAALPLLSYNGSEQRVLIMFRWFPSQEDNHGASAIPQFALYSSGSVQMSRSTAAILSPATPLRPCQLTPPVDA
jgi:D-arabinose 1-dehydrogenase-like Zn-dependent alcohol dehydrogenase